MCCKRFKHMLHVQRQLCNKANKHWNSNRTRYRCYMPVLFKSNHVHVFPTVVCPGGGGGEHICVYIYIHTCIHVTCNHRQIYIYICICMHTRIICMCVHACIFNSSLCVTCTFVDVCICIQFKPTCLSMFQHTHACVPMCDFLHVLS